MQGQASSTQSSNGPPVLVIIMDTRVSLQEGVFMHNHLDCMLYAFFQMNRSDIPVCHLTLQFQL